MQLTKKQSYIDYLKAIAAIFVVIHHALSYAKIQNANFVIEALYTLIVCTHVPLFLCIAGYLCHKQPLGPYFKKKALRLLIPFVVFSLLKITYAILFDSTHAHANSIGAQFADAFLTGSLYWFIYAILIMYAAAPLLWKMKKGNIVVFIALVTTSTLLEVSNISLGQYLQLHNTVTYGCYFVAGILIQQYATKLTTFSEKHKKKLLAVAALLIVGILCFKLNYDHPMPHFLKVLVAFSMMYVLFRAAKTLPATIKPLSFIGNISLQVMLFDSFFKVVLFKLIPATVITVWPIILINLLLTYLCCLIIKKIPIIRVLFGL